MSSSQSSERRGKIHKFFALHDHTKDNEAYIERVLIAYREEPDEILMNDLVLRHDDVVVKYGITPGWGKLHAKNFVKEVDHRDPTGVSHGVHAQRTAALRTLLSPQILYDLLSQMHLRHGTGFDDAVDSYLHQLHKVYRSSNATAEAKHLKDLLSVSCFTETVDGSGGLANQTLPEAQSYIRRCFATTLRLPCHHDLHELLSDSSVDSLEWDWQVSTPSFFQNVTTFLKQQVTKQVVLLGIVLTTPPSRFTIDMKFSNELATTWTSMLLEAKNHGVRCVKLALKAGLGSKVVDKDWIVTFLKGIPEGMVLLADDNISLPITALSAAAEANVRICSIDMQHSLEQSFVGSPMSPSADSPGINITDANGAPLSTWPAAAAKSLCSALTSVEEGSSFALQATQGDDKMLGTACELTRLLLLSRPPLQADEDPSMAFVVDDSLPLLPQPWLNQLATMLQRRMGPDASIDRLLAMLEATVDVAIAVGAPRIRQFISSVLAAGFFASYDRAVPVAKH